MVQVLILNEEFAVDLGGCLRWGKQTDPYLRPVTDVCQQKIRWAGVQSYFVRMKQWRYYLLCRVSLEVCVNLTLGLL